MIGPAVAAWLARAFPAGLAIEDRCLPAPGLYPWMPVARLARGRLPVAAAEAALLDTLLPGPDVGVLGLIALATPPDAADLAGPTLLLGPPGMGGLRLRDAAGHGCDLLGPATLLAGLPLPVLDPAPPVARLDAPALVADGRALTPAQPRLRVLLGTLPGGALRLGLRLDGMDPRQPPALFVDGARHPATAAGSWLRALIHAGEAPTILGLALPLGVAGPVTLAALELDPA